MLVKGSFEDFIYILIGVVWIAFSIYKGMQKKKTQKPTTEDNNDYEHEPEKKKTAFETFMDNILVEEKPEPYKPVEFETAPEQAPEEKQQEENKIFSYDDYYEESNYREDSSVYEEADTQSTELKHQLKTSRKKSRKPHFNLRKAVVYSEILNRRYF